MKKIFNLILVLALMFGAFAAQPAQAAAESPAVVSPQGFLAEDGTLNLNGNFSGALDLEGWDVTLDPVRGPVFSQNSAPATLATQGEWTNLGGWSGPITNSIYTVAVSGSDVYIGGTFLDAGSIPEADYIARWDGTNWHALGSNGAKGGSLTGFVSSIAVSGSDVYVGGNFRDVNNNGSILGAADYIAKWDGSNWSALGVGNSGNGSLNAIVNSVAVDGSTVYAGGNFTNVNNNGSSIAEADYVAKFDGTNWSALGGSGNGALNNIVRVVAVDGSSNLYVGGSFTDAAGIGEADFAAKWDGSSWSALGGNGSGNGSLNNAVHAFGFNGSDVYVGGQFINVNDGGLEITAADYIAKWDGTNWSALGSNGASNGSLGRVVYTIVINGSDIYIGGEFTNVNNNGTGLPAADCIAKWNGSAWSALGSNGSGNGALNNLCFAVYGIGINGADIYAGGGFMDPINNGTPLELADYIARFDGTDWSGLGSVVNGSFHSPVLAVAAGTPHVFAGGNFLNASNDGINIAALDYIGKWDGADWSALSSASVGGTVFAAVVHGTDLYVGGSFANAGGVATADRIAKWDGTNWSALGNDGGGNGSVSGTVRAIAVNGTDVYIGGDFTNVNNGGSPIPEANRVAKWDGTNWSALGGNGSGGGSLNGGVNAIAVSGTDVYVGGSFTDVNNGGLPIPEADYIAKWNGTNWSALGSNGSNNGSLNSTVYAIAVSGTDVYAGGTFTNVNNGGSLIPEADYIAKWNSTNWSALGGSGNGALNERVLALAVRNTHIYAGGYFTNANGIAEADYIAQWNGTNWSALGNDNAGDGSLNGGVLALSILDNDLYVGGEFTNVNNNGTVLHMADYMAAFGLDNIAPTVVSITRASASPTAAASVDFTVTFSKPVTGVDVTDFTLGVSPSGASITGVSGSGDTYTVTVNTGTGNGTLRLDVLDDDTIVDGSAIPLDGGFTSGEVYTIDKTIPTVLSVTRLNTNPTSAASVTFAVTFSKPVTGVDVTDFTLGVSPSGASITGVSGSGDTYTVTVNTGTGNGTLRLDVLDDDTIVDGSATPLDGGFTNGEEYVIQKSAIFKSGGTPDGWILESSETSGAGGTLNKGGKTLLIGDDAQNRQYRAILSFPTASLPDNANITKVTLRVRRQGVTGGGNPITTFGGFMVDIKTGNFGTAALQAADFQTTGNKTYGAFKPKLVGGWYSINLTTGKNFINKLGNTQIRLRFKTDDNNNFTANFLSLHSGNAASASKPQLIVEFSTP